MKDESMSLNVHGGEGYNRSMKKGLEAKEGTKMGLSEREKRFCEGVARGLETEAAALAAGYKERTAAAYGRRLLAKADVQEEIERLRAGNAAAEDEILQFLTAVMRGEVQDGEPEGGKPPKVSERTKAAELLGRNQRLFSDKEKREAGEAVVKIVGADDLE